MTPLTQKKADAIATAIDAGLMDTPFAAILAMITSPNKDERNQAKRIIRSLAEAGAERKKTEIAANLAAMFANRFEPR